MVPKSPKSHPVSPPQKRPPGPKKRFQQTTSGRALQPWVGRAHGQGGGLRNN